MTEEEKRLQASRENRRDLEAELKEERDRYDAQNQEAYDKEVSGENFLKDRAQENEEKIDGGKLAQSIAFETSVGLATDLATTKLMALPPLYALANFVSGATANLIAQKIRGETKLSIGEILASGGVGIIPGTTIKTGKQLSKVVGKAGTVKRAAIATGLAGVGSEAVRIGIDEKRLLSAQEALVGGTLGGITGASLQKIINASPALLKRFNDLLPEREPPITVFASTKKPKSKIINRKSTLDRSDVEYVPTKREIKDVMKELGLPEDDQRAAFVAAVFKKDVADIQATKKFLNDYIYRNEPKNLKGLAEAISAQEGVEYTVADLSNIIKNQGAVTTRIVGGMPKSAKRIRNLVDLQAVLKDRLRKLRQQPTYNKGHANSIGQILKKSNVAGGADRPDNIFIEEARSIFSRDAKGDIKLEKVGNISKKDIGDDPLVVQRMKGFSPTVQESVLKLLRKQDLEVKRVYEGLGIDASDLDVIENIDLSTAVRPELRDWTEETVDDLVKSGVDPEKAVDYLLDINEELGDMLSAAGLREDMFMLFRKEPGLAAQFLNELIGNKKRGPGKLKNIPISDFERQMLATIREYFKENPLFKFRDVTKTVVRGITKPTPGERERLRNILKKKQDRGNL